MWFRGLGFKVSGPGKKRVQAIGVVGSGFSISGLWPRGADAELVKEW